MDEDYFAVEHHRCDLDNGDILQIETPESKNINGYGQFPSPINKESIGGTDFFLHSQLPKELQGTYLTYWARKTNKATSIHAKIDDPNLLRYAIDGLMPIPWWGDIKEVGEDTFIAGVYPTYYLNSEGNVLVSSVSFYKSEDAGLSWKLLGKIPYLPVDANNDEELIYSGLFGFQEPAFEILKDGSFFCVMRTGSSSPMYRSFSSDEGKHWSRPEPFTPNGVNPRLMTLGNGILVLLSGRPGMQLRINLNGDGRTWTEPIDMIPFMKEDGGWEQDVSCSYPDILRVDDQTFYMVYSDFTTKDEQGEKRKSILFRKIQVIRKNN